jgi:hypothetical protein
MSARNGNPGPGQYTYGSTLEGQKYSMSGRPTKEHDEKVPGPGAYMPSMKLVQPSNPNHVVGSGP